MLIQLLFLLFILGLEASFGLPVFFLYLSYKLVNRRKINFILFFIFFTSFFLAIFYSISWPVLAFLFLIFLFFHQKLSEKPVLQSILFLLLNLIIFNMANLQLNYFYLFHLTVFVFYFYKANFKKYAA